MDIQRTTTSFVMRFFILTRDEKKFETIDELAEQITKDCNMARAFHQEKM